MKKNKDKRFDSFRSYKWKVNIVLVLLQLFIVHLIKLGFDVYVEIDAGLKSGYSNKDYEKIKTHQETLYYEIRSDKTSSLISMEDSIYVNNENKIQQPKQLVLTGYISDRKKIKAINKKPIRPSINEIGKNSRSKSAKLRIAEKIWWGEKQ